MATTTQTTCLNCDGTGLKAEGWAGQPSRDGTTCPDCRGTKIDKTLFGIGGDHCPHCGADWKAPHNESCVVN